MSNRLHQLVYSLESHSSINELNVDFFNRLAVSFFNSDKVECLDKDCFSELINNDKGWKEDNLVFNNQIKTLNQLKGKEALLKTQLKNIKRKLLSKPREV
jgi:hypothetical protein